MARRTKEPAPAEEVIQAELPAAEEPALETAAVVPSPQPQPEPPAARPAGPSLSQRLGRLFRFLLNLLLLLLLLGGIGAGLYFGLPIVYERYILPVQENSAQMAAIQSRQADNEQAVAELRAQLETLEGAQAEQAQVLDQLDGRVGSLESEIAAHTQTLAALEEMQSTLEAQGQATNAELSRQVDLLKSMELLARARLFLYQSNFGLAKQDVQAARDLLADLRPAAPANLAEDLDQVLLRLDLTLSNLPGFPVAASDDLDIAWIILLGGVPPVEPSPTPTAAPTLEVPSATPTPTAAP
ncbi:MAG: hypothetical protein ACOY0R_00810 [Chloroflexota bacterium]